MDSSEAPQGNDSSEVTQDQEASAAALYSIRIFLVSWYEMNHFVELFDLGHTD